MSKLINIALILLISVVIANSDLIPHLTSEPINNRILQTQISEEMLQISPETLNQLLRGYLRYYNLNENPPCSNWTDSNSIFDDFDYNSTELIDESFNFTDSIQFSTWEDLINSYTAPIPPSPYYSTSTIIKPKPTTGTLPSLGDLIINYSVFNPSYREAIFSSIGTKLPTYSDVTLDDLFDNYLADPNSNEDLKLSEKETFLFIKLLKKSGLIITKV